MATYSGTPATWTAGQTVTASDLNAEVRDPLAALAGAWNSWTPTITQSGTITATPSAHYIRVGKLVIAQFVVTMTGSGTAGQWVTMSLPVTAAQGGHIGTASVYDVSTTTHYPCIVAVFSGLASVSFRRADTVNATPNSWGADPNLALASGDQLQGMIVYEAA